LSAAIYMGRFLRDTVVLDAGEGRSSFEQVNDNYLGFPNGLKVKELRELGRQQAERFGVKFIDCNVERLERAPALQGPTTSQQDALGTDHAQSKMEEEFSLNEGDFIAHTSAGRFAGRTVILCTGVCDIWPAIDNVQEYVGRSLFWCITCDGFRTFNKRIILYGRDEDAATTACQFNLYTKEINFIVPSEGFECSEERLCAIRDNKINLIEGEPAELLGQPDELKGVRLKDGTVVDGEVMFSLLGVKPTNKLAIDVGAKLTREGYVIVDQEGYTSVPGFFGAGDVSGIHTHQVVSAAHEGAEAAQTANYYLYADYQKLRIQDVVDKPEHIARAPAV
jgi:thioredoxin reductase (NADPH)